VTQSKPTTFTPTQAIASNAEKGLKLHEKFNKGGTSVGLKRAQDLKNQKDQTTDDMKKIYSYFARHEIDKKAADFGNNDNPSKGYIAWLLWGGDDAQIWVNKHKEKGDF